MLRSRRESLHRNGITDLAPLQQTSATKSALFGHGAMSDLSPLCAPKRTFANASGFIGSRPSDIRLGSGAFAPPFRPPDFMGSASGLHDDLLIGGTESPIEASQRGLDEPRLEGNLCRLAVGIEFPGHP